MKSPHWTIIGHDIARQTADMNKGQRVNYVRTCAESFRLSPHTVRRFVVLAQFLEKLGISGPQTTTLPIGTMEIIYRIYDHGPAEAKVALTDLLRGNLSYGEALKRLDKVKNSDGDRGEHLLRHEQVLKRIGNLLKIDNSVSLVEMLSTEIGLARLSRSTALYRFEDKIIAYISEAVMVAENQRGIKNLSRIIVLSACESDMVVVDFMSRTSYADFQKHLKSIHQDVRNRIKMLEVA